MDMVEVHTTGDWPDRLFVGPSVSQRVAASVMELPVSRDVARDIEEQATGTVTVDLVAWGDVT